MKKKLLSLTLAIAAAISLLTVGVFAAPPSSEYYYTLGGFGHIPMSNPSEEVTLPSEGKPDDRGELFGWYHTNPERPTYYGVEGFVDTDPRFHLPGSTTIINSGTTLEALHTKWATYIDYVTNYEGQKDQTRTYYGVTSGTNLTLYSAKNVFGNSNSSKIFAGWNTKADGSGTSYDANDSIGFGYHTLYAQWTDAPSAPSKPTRPGSGNSSSDDRDYADHTGGNSGSSGTTTEKHPDGSTTTTTKDNNGTVVENTKYADGSSTQVKTRKDGTVTTTTKDAKGNQTETVQKPDGSKEFTAKQKDGSKATASVDTAGTVTANVEVSKKAVQEAAKQGQSVQLPIPPVTSEKGGKASTVTVDLPKNSGKVNVVIPVAEVTPGTVAIIVHPDGTEEVVIQSKLTENGLGLTLEGGATLKIVDNSKHFDDVKPNDWFNSATDFVSSRNLFAGTSETEFSPNTSMTMEMLFAVAHNFMGKPETTASGVAGAKPEDWFHTASNWAAEQGLTNGLKMDMLGSNQPISREDTAILLFNLSGKAAGYVPSPEALAKLNAFTDIADMAPSNRTALLWAVENGIMNGMGDGTFGFKGNNTRAQTGAVMMNFNNNL